MQKLWNINSKKQNVLMPILALTCKKVPGPLLYLAPSKGRPNKTWKNQPVGIY